MQNQKRRETDTLELAEIIFNAIKDEPHFTKNVLVPKIKALIGIYIPL